MEVSRGLPSSIIQGVQTDRNVGNSTEIKNVSKQPSITTSQMNKENIQDKIDSINQFMKTSNTNLKFSLHEELNEYYVAIVDELTNDVIKEIPPKKLLDMFASMKKTIGIFIDKKI
ncbi:flagellar protein FlaG [Halalkalibacter alkalisediminis]|uniref:Flagellar protein FlaG n=1 Tax=Halalkalibacter alkalisediminis TaxID=935616 RepID=A0ABV6NEV5_9BACI|nr:flagellar protein FlaG [Halalkalibacter alkalisediminis]